MRFFEKAHDGSPDSGVTGYYLVEIKPLFSIVLLRFSNGARNVYHNHAFNALTFWLSGKVKEFMLSGQEYEWKAGDIKYTPRSNFHRIEALSNSWALTLRGPWVSTWKESREKVITTLTHGRKVVKY